MTNGFIKYLRISLNCATLDIVLLHRNEQRGPHLRGIRNSFRITLKTCREELEIAAELLWPPHTPPLSIPCLPLIWEVMSDVIGLTPD